MDTNQYTKYLIVLVVLLTTINHVVLFSTWEKSTIKAVVPGLLLFNMASLYLMTRVKVTDKGNEAFGDVLAVTGWLVAVTVVSIVVGGIISYQKFGPSGLGLPLLANGIFYLSLVVQKR